jgi:hypothetical protein
MSTDTITDEEYYVVTGIEWDDEWKNGHYGWLKIISNTRGITLKKAAFNLCR